MTKKKYNGWKNRETWALALHIDNNQCFQAYMEELAENAREEAEETSEIALFLTTALEDWITEIAETFFNPEPGEEFNKDLALMFSDVGSIWRVDFREIAENWLVLLL